ncbi:MAG: signal peptide peptidase SppA [Actinobacteria bacterium]|nr:signal peptide peptidase SppA [Actinomycetota bacterium]
MRKGAKITLITISAILAAGIIGGTAFFFGVVFTLFARGGPASSFSGDNVALIRMDGLISSSGGGSLFSGAGTSPETIINQILTADGDSSVKAILIRINSPGGSAAASQEMYLEVLRAKKPVIVSVGDVCASGAYYVSSAADFIMASPSSLVGSIGVITEISNYEELYKKLGVKFIIIKQGKYKDLGDPGREPTAEEIEMLKEQGEKVYDRFIKDVASGRNIDEASVREMATGMVFLGQDALDMGLIDGIGNYEDAVMKAAELGGIKGRPNVIDYSMPDIWDVLSGRAFVKSLTDAVLESISLSPVYGGQSIR